jgi:hypothetical protein
LYICLDAPRKEDFDRWPRFAANAAPAAICCFFDFAGIPKNVSLPKPQMDAFNPRRRVATKNKLAHR